MYKNKKKFLLIIIDNNLLYRLCNSNQRKFSDFFLLVATSSIVKGKELYVKRILIAVEMLKKLNF